jgi:hypothetical protein
MLSDVEKVLKKPENPRKIGKNALEGYITIDYRG